MHAWAGCLIAEAALFTVLLWRGISRWLMLWVAFTLAANVAELAMCHSPGYDTLWRGSECMRIVLLCFAVAECSGRLPGKKDWPLAMAGAAGSLIHMLLRYPFRWPNSYLEVVYSGLAIGNLVLGLFTVQVVAVEYCLTCAILTLYMLFTAICYYAVSILPIGTAVMLVELMAMASLLCVALSGRRVSPKLAQ